MLGVAPSSGDGRGLVATRSRQTARRSERLAILAERSVEAQVVDVGEGLLAARALKAVGVEVLAPGDHGLYACADGFAAADAARVASPVDARLTAVRSAVEDSHVEGVDAHGALAAARARRVVTVESDGDGAAPREAIHAAGAAHLGVAAAASARAARLASVRVLADCAALGTREADRVVQSSVSVAAGEGRRASLRHSTHVPSLHSFTLAVSCFLIFPVLFCGIRSRDIAVPTGPLSI